MSADGDNDLPNALARVLAVGDLRAVFLPDQGMLGASLRYRDEELLGRVDAIAAFARAGRACGIPLLHPWANRLGRTRYHVAGQEVELDPGSPLLHADEQGLPMHGVPWARLVWEVTEHTADTLAARLDWRRPDLLTVFPFPHRLDISVRLAPTVLTVQTTLVAGSDGPVPVSFGFHPYLSLAGLPRADWSIRTPAMRRLLLDERQIPTGATVPYAALDTTLGDRQFDDGFILDGESATFAITGRGRRVSVELVEGYPYAQVFAPSSAAYLAFEPMTAPSNALVSGQGLRLVAPSESFRATFRIVIEDEK